MIFSGYIHFHVKNTDSIFIIIWKIIYLLSIYLSFYLPIHLSICISISLPVCMCAHACVCQIFFDHSFIDVAALYDQPAHSQEQFSFNEPLNSKNVVVLLYTKD